MAVELRKIKGLELLLKSINCEKYKSKFEYHGINEHTLIHLTADDLRCLDVDNEDIYTLLDAINVLKITSNNTDIKLSKDEICKLQSNICGQLGIIALALNHIHRSITTDKNNLKDMLIDNQISAIDAALMLKPYMRAEEENIENTLKSVFKIKTRRKTIMVSAAVCIALVFGITFRRLNYSFNFNSIL